MGVAAFVAFVAVAYVAAVNVVAAAVVYVAAVAVVVNAVAVATSGDAAVEAIGGAAAFVVVAGVVVVAWHRRRHRHKILAEAPKLTALWRRAHQHSVSHQTQAAVAQPHRETPANSTTPRASESASDSPRCCVQPRLTRPLS